MALPTGVMTSTTLAEVIPELWNGGALNDFYRANLVAGNFFTDYSDVFQAGGDILHVPTLTTFSATAVSFGTAVALNSDGISGSVTLTVDQWYEASAMISDRDAKQMLSAYSLQEKFMANLAYAAAASLEDAIIALFDNFSQTAGTSAAGMADSDVRTAIQYLDNANVPEDGRAFFVTPKAVWTDLQSIDKFTLVNNTPGGDPVMKGFRGYLYGIPVYVSSRIGTTLGSAQNALAHKDAIIHASGLMRVQTSYLQEYLGTLVTADILYGVIENRDTSGVWIKTAAV